MVLTKNAPEKQPKAKVTTAGPAKPNEKKKSAPNRTRVIIRFDVGFNNHISIRGHGANLSWDKGVMLKNTKHDEWVWETDQKFDSCEFKVLVNDTHYEQGNNHTIACDGTIAYTPRFA
jgi:hypothetical protein